ncbi:unnamed protein product [Eruca vesicaria subsp. sativa]|uniref:RING-type domain-containing protein n=1 Tax=Eruca vesicaria subsp. sativa TaxID=29727 RepID=A0ABC8J5C7_ERUVS|nr:unnamed protein product [Eruca vesicaria subsp. sativa]
MSALNNFAAAEKEDDQLGRIPEAEEKEEDPNQMDVMETEESEEEEDPEETSPSSTSEEESELEFVEDVELEDIRKHVQCPICLGIIRKTRTVMGCLHRFCQECIDKSMRQGNHECPACRKHCASRRSTRPDPLFDAFIAATFGNIDSYEEQDLEFDEDELAHNKQIQESIAQVSQRQSEALVKMKSSGEDEVLPRSQPSGSGSRRRRRSRNVERVTLQAHGDAGDNNRGITSSSSADPSAEILPRKRKRRSATRSTAHPSSSSGPNNNANNVTEEAHHRDCRAILDGLAWGSGGRRSNIRQVNHNQGNHNQGADSKSIRKARVSRLVEYLVSIHSNR